MSTLPTHAFSCYLADSPTIFLLNSSDLLKDVHGLRIRVSNSQPLLVHCSSGVGRSGVLVLMDYLMASYDAGEVREEIGYW